MPRKLLIILIVVIALGSLVAPAAAQSNETNTTSTSEPTPEPTPKQTDEPVNSSANEGQTEYWGDVYGDPLVRILDASYQNSVMTVTFEADSPRLVTVTAPTGATSPGATGGALVRKPIPSGTTTVKIDSPEPTVWVTTSTSVTNGQYTEVTLRQGGLISGPWTAADVRDAGFGAAAGVALMVLYRLVLEHSAVNKDGERVA